MLGAKISDGLKLLLISRTETGLGASNSMAFWPPGVLSSTWLGRTCCIRLCST